MQNEGISCELRRRRASEETKSHVQEEIAEMRGRRTNSSGGREVRWRSVEERLVLLLKRSGLFQPEKIAINRKAADALVRGEGCAIDARVQEALDILQQNDTTPHVNIDYIRKSIMAEQNEDEKIEGWLSGV